MSIRANRKAVKLVRQLFINAENEDCLRAVWNLVSAMRGPDVYNDSEKFQKTTPIRIALLTINQASILGVSHLESFRGKYVVPKMLDVACGFSHFDKHIRLAQDVINRR